VFNLSVLDWCAIILYFIVITGIGVFFSKNVKSMHDFFMGEIDLVS